MTDQPTNAPASCKTPWLVSGLALLVIIGLALYFWLVDNPVSLDFVGLLVRIVVGILTHLK